MGSAFNVNEHYSSDRSVSAVIVDPAYTSRGVVHDFLRRIGDYRTGLANVTASTFGWEDQPAETIPLFRKDIVADGKVLIDDPPLSELFYNDRFLDAACTVFGGTIARPQALYINASAPMPQGQAHKDTPTFRGLSPGRSGS